jgi:hypothetical protein
LIDIDITRRSPYSASEEKASADEATLGRSSFYKIHHGCDDCRNNDPGQLVPVEKRDARKFWVCHIVKGRPAEGNERDDEEKEDRMELPL